MIFANDKVILLWQGKPYSVPVQKYAPKGKDGKVVVGEAPTQPTLPVPEITVLFRRRDAAGSHVVHRQYELCKIPCPASGSGIYRSQRASSREGPQCGPSAQSS